MRPDPHIDILLIVISFYILQRNWHNWTDQAPALLQAKSVAICNANWLSIDDNFLHAAVQMNILFSKARWVYNIYSNHHCIFHLHIAYLLMKELWVDDEIVSTSHGSNYLSNQPFSVYQIL